MKRPSEEIESISHHVQTNKRRRRSDSIANQEALDKSYIYVGSISGLKKAKVDDARAMENELLLGPSQMSVVSMSSSDGEDQEVVVDWVKKYFSLL